MNETSMSTKPQSPAHVGGSGAASTRQHHPLVRITTYRQSSLRLMNTAHGQLISSYLFEDLPPSRADAAAEHVSGNFSQVSRLNSEGQANVQVATLFVDRCRASPW